jgi:glucose-6-phosphate-specific signal transduction histidine kinase
MAKDKEPVDPRQADRDAELAKQKEVTDALAAYEEQSRKDAEKALRDQQKYETTGIRTVEGKP